MQQDVPDQSVKLTAATMKLTNTKIYGLKNFKIQEVSSEVKGMKAKCRILFDSFQLIGNYSLSSFFTKSKGMIISTVTNYISSRKCSHCRTIYDIHNERSLRWWCKTRSEKRWKLKNSINPMRPVLWRYENEFWKSRSFGICFSIHCEFCKKYSQ